MNERGTQTTFVPESTNASVKRVIDFWSAHAKGSGHPIASQAVWEALAVNGEAVIIHAVREGTTKFGETWFADIELAPYSVALLAGDPLFWTTAQSKNAVRDPLMESLRDAIRDAGPLPASIKTFETDSGQGWDFAPPPAEYLERLARVETLAAQVRSDDEPPF